MQLLSCGCEVLIPGFVWELVEMATATEVFKEVKERAEEICSDADQYFPEAASQGDYWRQGDIYISFMEALPSGYAPARVETQLAPGTTKGSRHILSHANVEMFTRKNADPLTGPVFKNRTEVTVTHPEHGNVVCPPGMYQITYQRAFAEELRRVRD